MATGQRSYSAIEVILALPRLGLAYGLSCKSASLRACMNRYPSWVENLAHQNRRVDGVKSPEIPQKEGVSGSEIATRHCTLKSQCKVLEIASDFRGLRWASQSQIAKSLRFRCAKVEKCLWCHADKTQRDSPHGA